MLGHTFDRTSDFYTIGVVFFSLDFYEKCVTF